MLKNSSYNQKDSALTLLVTCVTGADDTDRSIAFDNLAEFTSALDRRSDLHFIPLFLSLSFQVNTKPTP
jgi:hypothetical protein